MKPEQLEYQGFFRLPAPVDASTGQTFSFGGQGMCYAGNDILYVSGHAQKPKLHDDGRITSGTLVAAIRVPASFDDRADLIVDFFDPAPETLMERIARRLDTLGDIELIDGGALYSTWFRYYGTQPVDEIDDPTLAMGEARLLHLGPTDGIPYTQKATSKYLARIPDTDVARYGLGTKNLLCGRGDGAGNATSPRGPALFAVDPDNPSLITTLLYRNAQNSPRDWREADKWTGVAWVDDTVLVVGRKATGPGCWYGTDEHPYKKPDWFEHDDEDWLTVWEATGFIDPWDASKGYHSTSREVRLRAYAARDLMTRIDATPIWEFLLELCSPASNCRAMTYDPDGRRLFIFEHWPPMPEGKVYRGESPRIHVWTVAPTVGDSAPVPQPHDGASFRLDVSGFGTFEGIILNAKFTPELTPDESTV